MDGRRKPWGYAALGSAAVSALALVVLLVGILAGIEGARGGREGRELFDVVWLAFFFGGMAALVAGLVAVVLGTHRPDARTKRDGILALGYVAVAFAVALVLSAVEA